MTVNELLGHVVRLTGTTARVVHRPLPIDDPRRRKPDIGRAQALLGWSPLVPLEEGLASTCSWFAEEIRQEQPLTIAAE